MYLFYVPSKKFTKIHSREKLNGWPILPHVTHFTPSYSIPFHAIVLQIWLPSLLRASYFKSRSKIHGSHPWLLLKSGSHHPTSPVVLVKHERSLGIPRGAAGVANESEIVAFRRSNFRGTRFPQFHDVREEEEGDACLLSPLLQFGDLEVERGGHSGWRCEFTERCD